RTRRARRSPAGAPGFAHGGATACPGASAPRSRADGSCFLDLGGLLDRRAALAGATAGAGGHGVDSGADVRLATEMQHPLVAPVEAAALVPLGNLGAVDADSAGVADLDRPRHRLAQAEHAAGAVGV